MDLPLWLETVHEARGCPQCMETGYQGRTAVAELMPVGPEIADMIRENAPISRILQELRQAGMADIRDDALKKAAQGITSLSEIRRVLK
jgi:type II secretory ATPase GspE/PulE/Tfp pilus assembly ATPase PilB-like protein